MTVQHRCHYHHLWITPTTPFPDHPPLMVKGILFVVKIERTGNIFGKVFNKNVIARHNVPWQSPERVPFAYHEVTATQSIRRKVPFKGMFRLHFVSLNMTQSNVANRCAFDNIPFFYYTNKVRPWPWGVGGRGSGAVGYYPKCWRWKRRYICHL